MTTFRELQEIAHRQSAEKGFHDYRPEDPEARVALHSMKIALMHSELSEALEELRAGHAPNETYYPNPPLPSSLVAEVGVAGARELIAADREGKPKKPEGVPSELADVVIRIMDYCGAEKIDLEAMIIEKLAYNATRGKMHGGKKF